MRLFRTKEWLPVLKKYKELHTSLLVREKHSAISITGPFRFSECCPGSRATPGAEVLSADLCNLQQRQHQVTNRAARLERIRAARSSASAHFPLDCEAQLLYKLELWESC